ncbi:C-C chemokine receptor type 3-like [Mytilus edulis]|uniref:C-C chemokine receptor type 3-like n=1 Tax=Mytilus edulis TaxID=6550 RepID=UPI0039F02088
MSSNIIDGDMTNVTNTSLRNITELPNNGSLLLIGISNEYELVSDDMPSAHELEIVLTTWVPPILIVLGSIGNILTLLIMRRPPFCHYAISFYITAYAVSSLLAIYLFLGSEWIAFLAHAKTIDDQTDWLCRLWQFISRAITYSSIWFVVAMTIDRYIIIWQAKHVSSMCTLFMAKFVAVIIMVGLVVISIHAMWLHELMMGKCYFFHNEDLHAIIWPWVSASFYSYIPLTLIFIFDVSILTGLCLKRPTKGRHHEQLPMVLTYTTLGLSMMYFVFVIPPTVINIVIRTYPPSWLEDYKFMTQLKKASIIGHYMAWVNTVTVFYVCLFFSRTFRLELVAFHRDLMEKFRSYWCIQQRRRIYELHVGSNSSAATQVETVDMCTETTPL